MGNKEYVYSVKFKANTSEIKNAVQNLRQTLDTIQSRPIGLDDGSIRAATNSARELQTALQKAVNTDTGKLDISKFSQQLKASGKDLAHYANNLKLLGTDGRKAFMQLTQAIAQAEVPLKKNNKLIEEFTTTLKNTARWQLSSSIVQGFTSAIAKAIGYVKDLDKSLNDIRIVSGKSAEYMEDFAEKANRAAKNLSASTLEYTNAAKIFYQQGLGDAEVEERTQAVVKMAKVTGESAEQISSYMTAVWNNFDDGTKSLEYYTDAMTALGATTAASTEEIAVGLEKFAAIGDTVGLSYEYATSMVATLVDKTRQSSETIGTALKTVLGRIQGLSLGETLEDGTTLNKYSKALASVGVQIKDQFGNLKDMDIILDELGARWNTLAEDQQAALAQTLGGARQYTQIISLMDNYKDFKINVGVAEDSEGTLNRQMKIYEESVEAAQNRMKASLEGLYEDLVPEDTIKDFYNLMSSLVDSLGGFIEGMGGIGNVLLPAIGMLANRYMPQLVQGAFNLASNFRQTFSFSKQSEQSIIVQAQELLKKQNIVSKDNENYQKQLSLTQKILELKREQETIGHKLTKEQQARNIEKQKELQLQIDILEAENEQQKAREASMHKMVAGETEDAIASKGAKIEEERQAEIQKTNDFIDDRQSTAMGNGASEEVIARINANRDTKIQAINTEYDNKYSDMETEEIARTGERQKAANELKDSYMGSTLLERSGINNLDGQQEDKSYGISLQSSNMSGVMGDIGNRVEKANQAFAIGSQGGLGIDSAQMEEIVALQTQFQEQWELASDSAKKYEKNEKKILKNKKNEAALEKKIRKDTATRNKLQKQQQKAASRLLNYNKQDGKYTARQIKLAKEREEIDKELSSINKTIDADTQKLNKSKEATKALGGDALIQAQQAMSTAEQLGAAEKAALDGKIQAQIENAATEQTLKDQTIAGIQEIATEEGMMFDNRTQADIA